MRVGPGWYVAYPTKDHAGGQCAYCLSVIRYYDALLSSNLPEMSRPRGNHVMRRLDKDTQIVYELEGRKPDYWRKRNDGE